MKADEFQLGWVDLLTVIVLFVGIMRGRKRGLSEELLDTLQWIAIVLAGGLYYGMLAQALATTSLMSQVCYNLISYALIALTIKAVVLLIKRRLGDKIIGSDIFGRGEYYFGMAAGMVRFACIYVFLMSFLHAPFYTPDMLAANAKYQDKNFGDIRFPTIGSMQQTFFKESATGWAAERYLAVVLVQPAGTKAGELRSENSLGRRREQAIDVMTFRK